MSLLLDALKKAAQEKLEKQDERTPSAPDGPGREEARSPVAEQQHAPAPPSETRASPDLSDEEVLELVPLEDEELSIDTSAFADDSNTDYRYRRSQVLASELRAFERGTNFSNDNRGDDSGPAGGYPNWTMEPVETTDWNSPLQAAQIFSSKKPGYKRPGILLLVGVVLLTVLLAGGMFAYRYLTQPDDDFLVVMSGPKPGSPGAAASTTDVNVDPTLLIEQEDYDSLLANDLGEPVNHPSATGTDSGQVSGGENRPPAAGAPQAASAGQAPTTRQAAFDKRELQIHRTGDKESLQDILMRGYAAYHKGEFDNAEIAYRQALTRAPESRDAMLGMAAVRYARGDTREAADYYHKLLQRDPKDELALAALAGIEDMAEHAFPKTDLSEESRIKLLLAEKPDSGYLHFTLGNLYADARRWAEAQRAYFDAHRLEPANPDYAFNLAVSLDHLGKTRQAVGFYRQSLTLARDRKANFDTQIAVARLGRLQQF